jgi:quercetin dioxygenase-like cupin family protein
MTIIEAPKDGDVIDALGGFYPTVLRVKGAGNRAKPCATSTHFGYVLAGNAKLEADPIAAKLEKGSFFAVPGEHKLTVAPDSLVVVVERLGYRGQLVLGSIETRGRLSYIDGCSDSLLVYPPRQGDPCLNYLHFPRGVHQSQHTHPTIRAGVVARGRGKAFRVPSAGSSGWEVDLKEGCVFILHEQEQHSFRTTESDEEMDVVAFHPDSDWGPTDAAHPMRNRTYIGNDRSGAGQ